MRPVIPTALLVVAVFVGVLWGQASGAFDTVAPEITVRIPPDPAPAPWVIEVVAHDALPGVATVVLSLDGVAHQLPQTGGPWSVPLALDPGAHSLVITATDASLSANVARSTHTLVVAAEPRQTRSGAAGQ